MGHAAILAIEHRTALGDQARFAHLARPLPARSVRMAGFDARAIDAVCLLETGSSAIGVGFADVAAGKGGKIPRPEARGRREREGETGEK